jgi:tRNA A-37 threonylcarbamoyl transferase component Bud32
MSQPFDLAARCAIDHDFTGETLGKRYMLERRIGYGGAASIYAATDLTTKAKVAVKVLHPEHNQDQDFVRRFTQEAQIAAQVRHPCLVRAYDLGWFMSVVSAETSEPRRYTVFELVEGRSIGKALAESAMPWERTVPIVLDLLAGLAALHARGVAHRDISPNNAMIEVQDGTERGRLLDLGYARMIEEDKGLVLTPPDTSTGMMFWGSEGYVAPERFRGRPGDYRADIFSIGALWTTMLSGEAMPDPRDADSVSVASRITLPDPLRAVLLGALDVRDRRHHSATSMAEALRVAMQQLAAPPPAAKRRVHPAVWFAPALGLLAVPAWLAFDDQLAPGRVSRGSRRRVPDHGGRTFTRDAGSWLGGAGPRPAPPRRRAPVGTCARSPVARDPRSGRYACSRRGSPRRVPFDLVAALAACKPHATTRLVIAYDPKGPLEINDEAPIGEMGRCVEDVLALHPPRQATTLRP